MEEAAPVDPRNGDRSYSKEETLRQSTDPRLHERWLATALRPLQQAEIGVPLREIDVTPLEEPVPDAAPFEEPIESPVAPVPEPERVPA